MFLALVDTLQKSNLFFPRYYEGSAERLDQLGFHLDKIDASNKDEIVRYLRSFRKIKDKIKSSKEINELLSYWPETLRMVKNKASESQFLELLSQLSKEGTDGLLVVNGWNSLQFSFSADDQLFANEAINHLLSKGAEPLIYSIFGAAMHLWLSVELTYAVRNFAVNDAGEPDNSFIDKSFLDCFMANENVDPVSRYCLSKFSYCLSHLTVGKPNEFWSQCLYYFVHVGHHENSNLFPKGLSREAKVEIYSAIMRIFKFLNLKSVAASYYGDNRESPEEARLRAIDQNRGFIYIAWAPYLKGVWETDLKKKSFSDAVKIGYSDDPDRRKNEIAGNIGPSNSIEILDVWPVFDMKKAEQFVHHKLKRFRLSPDRELFGLNRTESVQRVGLIINEYEAVNEKGVRTSSKGF